MSEGSWVKGYGWGDTGGVRRESMSMSEVSEEL